MFGVKVSTDNEVSCTVRGNDRFSLFVFTGTCAALIMSIGVVFSFIVMYYMLGVVDVVAECLYVLQQMSYVLLLLC